MWQVAPHEWAYGFGMATAALFAFLIYSGIRTRKLRLPVGRWQWSIALAALLILAWPVAFSTWQSDWNAFLKSVPFLNSASFPVRWAVLYIPIVAVTLGLLLENAGWARGRTYAAAACLVGTVVLAAMEPRSYYQQQPYDARPVLIGAAYAREHPGQAKISVLGTAAELSFNGVRTALGGNDTLVAGMSQIYCYNPIFGYRLERFSAVGLEVGDVLKEKDGYLNLKNPACYVFPEENDCRPGDRFRADQLEQAKAFVGYRPFAFRMSTAQEYAEVITRATLTGVAASLLAWLVWLGLILFRRAAKVEKV
jgi:hypothetical protein